MKLVDQTLFGGKDDPVEVRGNCFPACIASILGISLNDVPHFYQLYHELDMQDQWQKIVQWCHLQGHGIMCWEEVHMNAFMHASLKGCLVIVSGESPRFKGGMHAVVGRLNGVGGYDLVHDPHPSRDGLVPRTAEMYELLFALTPRHLEEGGYDDEGEA